MEEEAERNPAMKEVLAKLTKVHKAQVMEKERQDQRRKEDQGKKQKRRKVGRPERQDDYYIPSVPTNDPSLSMNQIKFLKYERQRAQNNKCSKSFRQRKKGKTV